MQTRNHKSFRSEGLEDIRIWLKSWARRISFFRISIVVLGSIQGAYGEAYCRCFGCNEKCEATKRVCVSPKFHFWPKRPYLLLTFWLLIVSCLYFPFLSHFLPPLLWKNRLEAMAFSLLSPLRTSYDMQFLTLKWKIFSKLKFYKSGSYEEFSSYKEVPLLEILLSMCW